MAKAKINYDLEKFRKIFEKGLENIKEGKLDLALKNFQKTLKIVPNSPQSLVNISVVYLSRGDFDKAEKALKEAISISSDYPEALLNLGVVYRETGRSDEAISVLNKALRVKPDYPEVLGNLGSCWRDKGKLKKALFYFKKALKVNPKIGLFLYNIGNIYGELGKILLAKKYYNKALDENPNLFNAYYNLGVVLQDEKKLEEAAQAYMNALKINPFYEDAWGNLAVTLSKMARWDLLKKVEGSLLEVDKRALQAGRRPGESPFYAVTRFENPEHGLTIASAWSRGLSDKVAYLQKRFQRKATKKKGGKIRLAFMSDGFRKFPTAQNLLGVLEEIDRKRFEVFLYSYGPDDNSVYRKRAEALADKFIDISKVNFIAAARKIKQDQADILVDLKGYSSGNRIKILALHPALIQVSLLGFAGTTGSDFINYIVADKTVIPSGQEKYYTEKIIYLPDCYWPTDDKCQISNVKFQMSNLGIPEGAFVFSSFNQAYKINAEIFETWINIIRAVPKSILVLWQDNEIAEKNVAERWSVAGLAKTRLIFAPTLPKEEHLARLRDTVHLGLDTTIVNGHTTTIDCLWAGVPVITVLGKHFMSRVSASMLKAVGMEELITKNLEQYEKLAVSLAKNKNKLLTLRSKLSTNLKTYALFDTERYTRNLEKAFLKIYADYKKETV